MLGALLTFFVVGLIALIVLSVILAVVGLAFSLAWAIASFLLFKVAPVLLVGWLIVRFLTPRRKRIATLERELLES